MNEKGFFNISLIIAMPFIFSILFSSFWTLWFLKINLEAQSVCQKHTLHAQEELVAINNQIISLNPLAHSLYIEKRRLKLIIANGTATAKAAAVTRLAMIIKEQKALLQIQESLFLKGNYLSKQHLYSLKTKWVLFQNKLAIYLKKSLTLKYPINLEAVTSQLSIKIDDTAPVYERRSNHWNEQQIIAQWQIPISEFFPRWFKKIVPIHKNWEGSCASHPHKGVLYWQAAIGEGKH